MLDFPQDHKIYLKPGATDMRKSINGLIPIIQNDMKLNPMEAAYFVFCNRGRQLLKILYWDKTGFALWLKRLEKDRFPWPQTSEMVRELDNQQIHWLLEGIDFLKAHEHLQYSIIS